MHERMKGWFARILLGLIIISFALFGVDAYFKGGGSGQWVAEVGKQKISALEFDEKLKQEQTRLRSLGEKDPAKLESKELKQSILDQMIRERILVQAALERGYVISDDALLPSVVNDPNFQEDGKFSEQRFELFLRQNRISRAQYFQSLGKEALVNNMMGVPLVTAAVSKNTVQRLAVLVAEEREVSKAVVGVDQFIAKDKATDAEIDAYYKAHPELSRVAERARIEYVVFSPEAMLPLVQLTDADIKDYYEQHASEFSTPEQREISHILIRLAPSASEAEKNAAEQKVQQILQEAHANPKKFGELAKQYSQDPSTADKGGDLGVITPGSIFPEVAKLAFEMKAGEVAGPVRSPAGLHILLAKSVRPGVQRSFAEVKDAVSESARRQAAMRRFNEEADKFGDLVYAQFSSLKPAADQYKLTIKTTDWFGRNGPAEAILKNEHLMQAVFSDEAIKQHRNTEAIEVAPNTLVAARVAEYTPPGQKPEAEVRADIERALAREHAMKAAEEAGKAYVAQLRQGQAVSGLGFGQPQTISRQDSQGYSDAVIREIFAANAKQLPAYVGLPAGESGYAIYRITKVMTPADKVAEANQAMPVLLQRAWVTALAEAYVESLKAQSNINVRKDVLEKSER